MTTSACPNYAGYRFPAEIISHAVWLYFRFSLSLRMADELLARRSGFCLLTMGSATCSTSAVIKFQSSSIEPPGPKPSSLARGHRRHR